MDIWKGIERMMSNDLREKIEILIRCLGGPENVVSLSNCMTRLRVVVNDESLVDEDTIRSVDDVMGIVHDRLGTYEIVVGPGKSRKYADQCREMGIGTGSAAYTGSACSAKQGGDWKGYKKDLRSRQKDYRVKSALKIVGDIFVPLIPGIITAGLCAGLATLIVQLVPDYERIRAWKIVYQLLTLISTSFMTYLTAWAGYRAAERFGGSPILGGMLGMITSLDGINEISGALGLFDQENPLNSILRSGKGGVLAVIIGVYLMSLVEKKIRSRMPGSLDVIFTPILTLAICTIPYILLVMPALGFVSSGIVWFLGELCMSPNLWVRILAGYVSSALFLPLVAAGMHHGLVALYSVQLQEIGYITLYPALAMAGAGQVGSAIALWLKARKVGNRKLCSVITGALPAGFLGIGEPLIYGVTLPLGKPFITAGLGAGFGGALAMGMEVAATTWGTSGILAVFVMTAGPNGPMKSVVFYLAGLIAAYVGGFVITGLAYDKKELIPQEGAEAPAHPAIRVEHGQALPGLEVDFGNNVEMNLGSHEENHSEPQDEIGAPADGKLVPMEDIPDPVFSSGTLGPCIGILPETGIIYAPCHGRVSFIAETGHAIAFSSSDGKNILLHVGIDTVSLEGRGFRVLTERGKMVEKGDRVMEANLEEIQKAGLSPMVITLVENAGQ